MMWRVPQVSFVIVCIVIFKSSSGKFLNNYIHHYEAVVYSKTDLNSDHLRVRRSLSENRDDTLTLKFHAHNRDFHLRLKPDRTIVSPRTTVEKGDGILQPFDGSHIYQGECIGERGSVVHGSIIEGVFAGTISLRDETFHVERAEVYLDDPQIHSIIYSEDDMDFDPYRGHMEMKVSGSSCGSADTRVFERMKTVQLALPIPQYSLPRSSHNRYYEEIMGYRMYSKEKNEHQTRQKRQAGSSDRTCTLFLQSDTMLWEWMTKPESEDGLGYAPERAREEISARLIQAVRSADKIYGDTLFVNNQDDISIGGINFIVHRIKILETEKDCPQGESTPGQPLCAPNIGVLSYLDLTSQRNNSAFCLGYTFTYRDFQGGTLGLAWVGYPNRTAGGVCQQPVSFNTDGQSVSKSLNTGIVSLLNHGATVPQKVTALTLAHEMGHNFGALHDAGYDCTPGSRNPPDENGNYLMYASATGGDKANNYLFSPCSKESIAKVLDAVINERGKTMCFTSRERAFCGNMIPEEDEECDCGYSEDCDETCCNPREAGNIGCTLTAGAICSPSSSPCCGTDCQAVAPDTVICSPPSECLVETYCQGAPECPDPQPVANNTPCNHDSQICLGGNCEGSICHIVGAGWEQCFLESPENEKSYDKESLCYVACKNSATDQCVNTGDMNQVNDIRNIDLKNKLEELNLTSIRLPPGSPCDNYKGYCDVFFKCRAVDAEGPLLALWNVLFGGETLEDIKTWIIKNWWAVLLMGVGLVIIMVVFVKLCAVTTPSSNPNKPPAKKIPIPRTLKRQPRSNQPAQRRQGTPSNAAQGRPPRSQNYEMKPTTRY